MTVPKTRRGSIQPSKLQLLQICAWSGRPDKFWPEEPFEERAAVGTIVHKAVEVGSLEKAIEDRTLWDQLGPNRQRECEALWAAWEASETSERVASYKREPFAWYDRQGNGGRGSAWFNTFETANWRARHTFRGKLDLVGVAPDGIHEIVDLKTGDKRETEDIATNLQLAAYAMLVAAAEKVAVVRVVLAYVTAEGVEEETHVLHREELAATRQAIHAIDDARKGKPEPVPGDHCNDLRCAARAVCPAIWKEAASILGVPTPSDAADWGQLVSSVNRVMNACFQVRDHAQKRFPEGLRLPNGKVYGPDEGGRWKTRRPDEGGR